MFIPIAEDEKGHGCSRLCLSFSCQKQSPSYHFVCFANFGLLLVWFFLVLIIFCLLILLLILEMGSYYVADSLKLMTLLFILIIESLQGYVAFIL